MIHAEVFDLITDRCLRRRPNCSCLPTPEGYEPWIKTRDAIETDRGVSTDKAGTYNDAWIQIEFSYPEAEGTNAVGEMKRIQLYGHAI